MVGNGNGWPDRALLDAIESLYDAADIVALAEQSVALLRVGVSLDQAIYCITDNARGRAAALFYPKHSHLPEFMPIYERLWEQNPIGREHTRTLDPQVRRLSDCIARHELERLPFHAEYLKPARIGDMMTGYMVRTEGYRLAVTAIRERGEFRPAERDRMEVIRRHLVRAFRNMITISRAIGEPIRAAALMEGTTSLRPGIVIRDGINDDFRPRVQLGGLSARQTEVLKWVVAGKTNTEIAVILGCSAGTVKKHLEQVYERLGVSSRTSASLLAVRLGLIAAPE